MQSVAARDLFKDLKPQSVQDISIPKVDQNPALENIVFSFEAYLKKVKEKGNSYANGRRSVERIGADFSASDITSFCLRLADYEKNECSLRNKRVWQSSQ